MDFFKNIYLKSNEVVFQKYFDLSVIEFITILTFLLFALATRSIFSKLIIKKIKVIVEKTNTKIDDKIFISHGHFCYKF